MHVNASTGLTMYDTFDELLNADIIEMTEDEKNYYILTEPQQYYENNIWVVNKKTQNVSFMYYTEYICNVIDNASQVDPQKFKRAS